MSRFRQSIVTIIVILASESACSDPPRSEPAFMSRDSAGIEIVENRVALERLPEWRPGEPELTIGTLDGDPEYQLYRVRDATRLRDGRIVVVNGGTAEVRTFAPDGTFQNAFGGEGEGPEEFGYIRGVHAIGDSVRVLDTRASRVSTWSLNGAFGGSVALVPPIGRLRNHDWLADGALVTLETTGGAIATAETAAMIPDAVGGTVWWPTVVLRYTPDGAPADTIARYRGTHIVRIPGSRPGNITLTSTTFSPEPVTTARGDRILGSAAADRQIEVRDRNGRLTASIRWTGPSLEVGEAEYEAYVDGLLARSDDPEQARADLERSATVVEPTFPALGGLHVAVDGGLWARRYDRPLHEPGERWLVFDAGGRLEGRVLLPETLRLHEIGSDYLLGVETDALDVEYVVLYDFDPPWRTSASATGSEVSATGNG